MNTFRQIDTKINPPKPGWYNTDNGFLYWYESEKEWSCRDDECSAEYPTFWYEEVVPCDKDEEIFQLKNRIQELVTAMRIKETNVQAGFRKP